MIFCRTWRYSGQHAPVFGKLLGICINCPEAAEDDRRRRENHMVTIILLLPSMCKINTKVVLFHKNLDPFNKFQCTHALVKIIFVFLTEPFEMNYSIN